MPESPQDEPPAQPQQTSANAEPPQTPSTESEAKHQTDIKAENVSVFQASEINLRLSSLDGIVQTLREDGERQPALDGESLKFAQTFAAAYSSRLRGIYSRGRTDSAPLPVRPEKMPETEEQIETWYCETLSPRERCFVRAAAILHGAPAHVITAASEELYGVFHAPPPSSTSQSTAPLGADSVDASHLIVANTFTEALREDDVRRLYWQDADANGYSLFGLKMLRLIAYEIEGTAGIRGQNSEPIIKQWAACDEIEIAWRAAHALGVIWWTLDQNRLKDVTSDWACAKAVNKRIAAAGVIFGAYEAETTPGDDAEGKHPPAPRDLKTLRLLRELANAARHARTEERAQALANTVTTAYGLLSIVSPGTAYDGLERLLDLNYDGESDTNAAMSTAVFIYGTLAYLTSAWHGQVRLALTRLAAHAERLIRLRIAAKLSQKERIARCERALEITHFIFFLLVTSSFTKADCKRYVADGQAPMLTAEPEIPDPAGKDVLLAGVLTSDEAPMRDAIVTLLCAGLLNGNAAIVMDILRHWADQLFPQAPADEHEQALWRAYRRFVESVGRQSQTWDGELGRTGLRAGFYWFTTLLRRWPAKKPSGELPQEVLGRLGVTLQALP